MAKASRRYSHILWQTTKRRLTDGKGQARLNTKEFVTTVKYGTSTKGLRVRVLVLPVLVLKCTIPYEYEYIKCITRSHAALIFRLLMESLEAERGIRNCSHLCVTSCPAEFVDNSRLALLHSESPPFL